MIKLIIFDLDGTLVEARDIHYESLNRALENIAGRQYIIGRDEHLTKYDGLSTRKKLNLLTQERGLSENLYNEIWKEKQKLTLSIIRNKIRKEDHIQQFDTLSYLSHHYPNKYKIYIASNAISETIRYMLMCSGLITEIDRFYSNEDVRNPKPHPEMYLRCMLDAGFSPRETLIVEDSHIGRKGAYESGAHVLGVNSPNDVTVENLQKAINKAEGCKEIMPKWVDKDLNVLIPMAGAGSRFEKAGYTFPKPLIEIHGKPMIQLVVDNLNIDANYIFICQKSHYEKYNLHSVLNLIVPGCTIVQVDGITEGAACTALLAKEYISNLKPLLIANSDQFIEWNSNEFLYSCNNNEIDGGILTFNNTHPKWSYAKIDASGYVTEVAEKKPISNNASVGIYWYAQGGNFVFFAEQMIRKNIRTNNEFYICPVYNEFIQNRFKIKTFPIKKMWGLGTPEDLQMFLNEYKDKL